MRDSWLFLLLCCAKGQNAVGIHLIVRRGPLAVSNDFGLSSSHFISWPFSNPSPRKCSVTRSAFSMQQIMNDRGEKLIGAMSDPSTSLPTNQRVFNATEVQLA